MSLFKGYSNSKFYGRTKMVPPKNGIVNGLYYINDIPVTGSYGGFYYVNGSKYTGFANNLYYIDGVVFTSNGTRQWDSSFDIGLSGSSSVVMDDGNVMFAGGHSQLLGASTFSTVTKIYEPATGTITSVGNMPGGRCGAQLLKLTNGKIACIGGFNRRTSPFTSDSSYTDGATQSFIYDPNTEQWSAAMSFGRGLGNIARQSFATALIPGTNKVFVVGGQYKDADGTGYVNDVWLLDYDAGTATARQPITGNVITTRTCAVLNNGKIIAKGRRSNNSNDAYHIYDLTANTWTFGVDAYMPERFLFKLNDGSLVGFGESTGSFIRTKYNSTGTATGPTGWDIIAGSYLDDSVFNAIKLSDDSILCMSSDLSPTDVNHTNRNTDTSLYYPTSDPETRTLIANTQKVISSAWINGTLPTYSNLLLLNNNILIAHDRLTYLPAYNTSTPNGIAEVMNF
jgi:hypothetical protein